LGTFQGRGARLGVGRRTDRFLESGLHDPAVDPAVARVVALGGDVSGRRGPPGLERMLERTWLSIDGLPLLTPFFAPGQPFGRETGLGMWGTRFVVVVPCGPIWPAVDGPCVALAAASLN